MVNNSVISWKVGHLTDNLGQFLEVPISYSDEVRKCFTENPDILNMSPVKLAEWFYIQGILYQSNVVAALDSKFTHYIKHISKGELDKAHKSWKSVNSFGSEAILEVEEG